MTTLQQKRSFFVLEGLNGLATTYYGFYLYFLLHERFGFGNLENLAFGALNGFVYALAAGFGGKFAQKYGYFKALQTGFTVMPAFLLLGLVARTVWGQALVLTGWTIGLCFTWPVLAGMVSEGEKPPRLQMFIGMYNLVWSGTGALAYFLGGAVLARLGPESLFYIPIAIHVLQLIILGRVERFPVPASAETDRRPGPSPERPVSRHHPPAHVFLRLAWVANPFAYVAINTIVAVAPALALNLKLNTVWAGFVCSIWLFSRMGAFLLLWLWPGWHYRLRWFFVAYLAMLGSFIAVLLAGNLWLFIAAQWVFGCAIGLVYYSSLYYSMDVGETKGEHGGFHEAAIGVGLFLGPASGAAALKLWPGWRQADTWSVAGLIVLGLILLAGVRWRAAKPEEGT